MIEVLKQALADAKRNERYQTMEESRYWLHQYKLLAEKAIAELESQEPVAWDLADKVRQDLDRQSCPDAFMRIAVESIVKHHPPQRTEQEPVSDDIASILACRDMLDAQPVPPQRTEPIQSLQCFHCQVTIETLNDKVMQLLAERTWVGLTDEEIAQGYETTGHYQTLRPQDKFAVYALARAIEAKLKEKNNG